MNDDYLAQIKAHRDDIDAVDAKLAVLLNQRFKASLAIGTLKKENNAPVLDSGREQAVIANITKNNVGPLTDAQLIDFYKTIMAKSKEIQESLRHA